MQPVIGCHESFTADDKEPQFQLARRAWEPASYTDWVTHPEADDAWVAEHREELSGSAARTNGGRTSFDLF